MSSDEVTTTEILGVKISATNMPSAVNTIETWVKTGQKHYVCLCTVHSITEADKDSNFKTVLNNAGLRCPDGMPLVWLSQRKGHRQVQRVYGPDLMLELCARSHLTGHRHYFYGGTEGIAQQLTVRLSKQFPGIQVAGTYTPGRLDIGEMEHPDTIAQINAAQPDFIWVGLGCPKQEWWAALHRPLLNAPVIVPVGAAFDFHSGNVAQAPRWIRDNGLEWLFRWSQDPRRLTDRYIRSNMLFMRRVIKRR